MTRSASPKVWRDGECLVGVSGNVGVSNAVQLCPIGTIPAGGADVFHYLISDYVVRLRDLAKARGLVAVNSDHAELCSGYMLIGIRGDFYYLNANGWSVIMIGQDYAATGSGAAPALGALYALTHEHGPPADHTGSSYVMTALRAAQSVIPEIQSPFVVIEAPQS